MRRLLLSAAGAMLVLAGLACNFPAAVSADPTRQPDATGSHPTQPLVTAAVTLEPVEPLSAQDLDRSEPAYFTVVIDLGGGSPALRGWYSLPGDEPLPLAAGQYLILSVSTVGPGAVYVSQSEV